MAGGDVEEGDLVGALLVGAGVLPLLTLSLIVLAAGEVLAGPLILSRIAGNLTWRVAPAGLALWLIGQRPV